MAVTFSPQYDRNGNLLGYTTQTSRGNVIVLGAPPVITTNSTAQGNGIAIGQTFTDTTNPTVGLHIMEDRSDPHHPVFLNEQPQEWFVRKDAENRSWELRIANNESNAVFVRIRTEAVSASYDVLHQLGLTFLQMVEQCYSMPRARAAYRSTLWSTSIMVRGVQGAMECAITLALSTSERHAMTVLRANARACIETMTGQTLPQPDKPTIVEW